MATILVVDDLAANREVLVSLLSHAGHTLVEAANGEDALGYIRATPPDLLITDVLMPVMDGYELVRQLRLQPATRGLPVIFYTAHYGEREARELAMTSGVSWVLTKPIEPEEALKVVDAVLRRPANVPLVSPGPLPPEFGRDHLRLLTDKLSGKEGDLQSANVRLRALVNISLELASERDSDRLLQRVAAVSRELFAAGYVTLGILERKDRSVRRVIVDGDDTGPWISAGAPAPLGMLNQVMTERRAVNGVNAAGDPVALGLPASHPRIRAYLAAPVASPSHVYGWVCLVRQEGAPFSAEDEQLVMALAGLLGRIYENGYFYSVAQRRAEALEQEVLVRESAEAALRHERDRSQQYLDTAQVLLVAINREGRIELANRHACSVLGWSPEELHGREAATLVPERLRASSPARLAAVAGGGLSASEHLVVTRSGEERLITWRNTVLRDEAGAVIGTLSSGIDVTEQNRAIGALRVAEERMRFALEAAEVGIWDMDYVAGTLRWSETLERQHGLAPRSFGGSFEAFAELMHPDDRAATAARIGKAMVLGSDFTLEYRALWSDGTVRRLSGAGRVVLDDEGRPVRGIGISIDVTERHDLEAQYQQAQKMEAVGRLAGGVAHDFNNLLTAILGYCEILLGGLADNDPRRKEVTGIHNAGTSAARLTRQLLAFSRKQIIEPRQIDLNQLLKEIRAMLSRMIGEDVAIELVLAPELGQVLADHGQIEQVIMNLAVNARDAMPGGGTLKIATENRVIDEHAGLPLLAPGRYVVLTVTDTGVGMSAEVQARLFEPFFTTKEVGKGTGLGLATVHGIVARSGGQVNVHSELGRGTAFEVVLPRSELPAADAGAGAVSRAGKRPAGGETVLVVDDAEQILEIVSVLLSRLGYRPLCAANADEAVRIFDANPSIDVLLTDVVMPGASGPELTIRLTEQRPNLRVIYMSGYTESAIAQNDAAKRGAGFLHKPFSSEVLGQTIREVLDRPR
jgi:PAS domain S-box-containing protein